MVNFPASLDALVTLTSSTKMNDAGYEGDTLINTLNRIAEALEAKVGTGASTPTANLVLRGTATGVTAWGQVAVGDYTAGSITAADLAVTAAWKKIGEATGTGGAVGLTISSIPGTYRALYGVASVRSAAATSNIPGQVFLNNDGSGLYHYQDEQIITSAASYTQAESDTKIALAHLAGNTAPTDAYAGITLLFQDYAGAKGKNFEVETYVNYASGASGQISHYMKGNYRSNTALSQIEIRSTSGNWDSSSKFTLWGLPA